MRVLVLENSRIFQKMLRELLEELGCIMDGARSGEEGLECLEQYSYDLIIAGQSIFDGTGEKFAQQCRSKSDDCPIILLTSEPNETLLNTARKMGITDIFPKTNVTYLRANIRYYIEGNKAINVEGGKILYVEDSDSIAHAMKKYLEELNLEVQHFKTAEEALAAFVSKDFDLVITDVVLEGTMNGVSLVRMIRAQSSHAAEIPILAITAHDDPKTRVELYRAGINDYITKPPVKEELAARVSNLISNKHLQDQVRAQHKSLYEAAMKDKLTTCHNRNCLVEFAPKYISDSIRYNFPLCVMILDLDFFKLINDEHGHTVGDTVLTDIGKLLMISFRTGDFVARLGGEEFMIIMSYCSIEDAMLKAEEVREGIEKSNPAGLNVTASIGVACFDKINMPDFDSVYKAADLAVYESKKNGRNRITLSKELKST